MMPASESHTTRPTSPKPRWSHQHGNHKQQQYHGRDYGMADHQAESVDRLRLASPRTARVPPVDNSSIRRSCVRDRSAGSVQKQAENLTAIVVAEACERQRGRSVAEMCASLAPESPLGHNIPRLLHERQVMDYRKITCPGHP